jgi:hypothetical protein
MWGVEKASLKAGMAEESDKLGTDLLQLRTEWGIALLDALRPVRARRQPWED